jgi:hypothetical protein
MQVRWCIFTGGQAPYEIALNKQNHFSYINSIYLQYLLFVVLKEIHSNIFNDTFLFCKKYSSIQR